MKVITSPDNFLPSACDSYDEYWAFLAGGISGCPNWQSEFIQKAKGDFRLFNPRREKFDTTDKAIEEEQIKWEYERLKLSEIIVFWFPEETLCPITLYELGRWGNSQLEKRILIGCHPKYKRRNDVIIQSKLDYNVIVHDTLDDLIYAFNETIHDINYYTP